jgi:hypothetical protein
MRNLLRPDTPPLAALADVTSAQNAATQTQLGVASRSALRKSP